MKQFAKLAGLLVSILLLVACAGTPAQPEAGEEAPVTTPPTEEAPSQAVPLEEQVTPGAAVTEEPAAADLISERKIYFDFDKSDIKPEFRDIVEAHAKYLAANPGASVTIEGHCDERGTREYNMALGERRAHSVMQMLTLLGVSKNQVSTVSFGEERPDVDGHDESAWKWNRRAVFVYSE